MFNSLRVRQRDAGKVESFTENLQPLAILDYNLLPNKAIGAGVLSSSLHAGLFSCGDKTMLVPITDASAVLPMFLFVVRCSWMSAPILLSLLTLPSSGSICILRAFKFKKKVLLLCCTASYCKVYPAHVKAAL